MAVRIEYSHSLCETVILRFQDLFLHQLNQSQCDPKYDDTAFDKKQIPY